MITRALWLVCLLLVSQLAAQSQLTISADARTGMEVTIYNSNIGLVKDTRSFSLTKGGRADFLLRRQLALEAETG